MRKFALLFAVLGLTAPGFSQATLINTFTASDSGIYDATPVPGGATSISLAVSSVGTTSYWTAWLETSLDGKTWTLCAGSTVTISPSGSAISVCTVGSAVYTHAALIALGGGKMSGNLYNGIYTGPTGGTGSPGGSPGSLQYNLGGAFAGFSGSCIPKLNGSSAPGCATAGTDYLQSITSSLVLTALGYTPLNSANNLSDVGSAATARTNLGIAGTGYEYGNGASAPTFSTTIPYANISGTPTPFITSLTTTGSSGAATVLSGVLNIPQYAGGGLSGLTSGYIPAATSPTAIGNSHMDDGATTAGVITSTEPIATSATGNGFKEVEAAAPSGVASSDIIYADSTAHRWKMNSNNGGAVQVVASGGDINTSDQVTATHLAAPQTVPQGGTGVGTGTGYAYGNGTSAFTFSTSIPYGNLSGTPTLPATLAKVSHQWLDSYTSSTGLFTQSQPAFTDISGTATAAQIPASLTSTTSVNNTAIPASATFGPLATVASTTGTGAGVLATSPSLITPNIGVATATSTGGSGSPTLAVGAASGTGATVTANSTYPNDNTEGVLTLVTGTGPATGTLATVTFSITRAKAPVCMVQLESATGQMTSVTQAATTTALTISAGTALAASSGYGILYLCGGN